jgi:hypothetical protein
MSVSNVLIEHLEIELSRTRDALKRYIVYHEMDHETTSPADLQSAYDEALRFAREIISGGHYVPERTSAFEISLYRVELQAGGEWCSSKGRFNWLHEARNHGEASGGPYRIFHLVRGCTCHESVVFDSTARGAA